ncbi:hypothetical protein H101_05683 [Trichophyton interdigitale H6]|nr:hypothetical protein H101_05683 [Trichophyton interdigitale H6]
MLGETGLQERQGRVPRSKAGQECLKTNDKLIGRPPSNEACLLKLRMHLQQQHQQQEPQRIASLSGSPQLQHRTKASIGIVQPSLVSPECSSCGFVPSLTDSRARHSLQHDL